MSYGLDLFYVPPGYTFDDALDALDEGTLPKTDLTAKAKLERNWSILHALLSKNPDFNISSPEVAELMAQNKSALDGTLTNLSAELHSEEGIIIGISSDEAYITVPYW